MPAKKSGSAKREVVWVKHAKEGGWNVEPQGGGPKTHFDTKDPAVDAAVKKARAAELGQVKVQKEDGTIQEERTYGKDPERTKG